MKLMMKIALSVLSIAFNVLCVIGIAKWICALDDFEDAMSNLEEFNSGDLKMVALGCSYGLAAATNDPSFFLGGISGGTRLIVACCSSSEAIDSECANAVKYIVRYGERSVDWRWVKGQGCFGFTVRDEKGNVWMDKSGDLMWALAEGAGSVDGGEDVPDVSIVCEECPSFL